MATLSRSGGTGRRGGLKRRPVKGKIASSRNHLGESSEIEPAQVPIGQCREINSTLDAIELALSEALREATQAQRWDVVSQLASELTARRLAKSSNVVSIKGAPRRKAP